MMQNDPARILVSLRDVSKVYRNGTEALRDISFEVRQGECVTLLGPSGCGKSTVLRLIAGLDPVSSGVLMHERGETVGPDSRCDMGFVFQEPALMPWANVFDNVFLPLRLIGQKRKEARSKIEAILAQVGLSDFQKAYPNQLSGGQRMRVSIARALVRDPALLLLDEPFAALDEITRFRLNDDLLRLRETFGTTFVFITHSIYESVYLSSRILVMAAAPGRIVEEIAIDASLERDENFRLGETYLAYCRKVTRALEYASGARV